MVALLKQHSTPDPVRVQGKSNEWYTPVKYIEAARAVMCGIDLDPASCEAANQTVQATTYYDKEDNGLSQEWQAKSVWLNPPFGQDASVPNEQRSTIRKWVTKLLNEYEVGNVAQAILLVTAETSATWFRLLWQYPLCFVDHKIRFYVPQGRSYAPGWKTDGHIFGTVFVYLGPNEQKFIETFSQFGRIVKAVDVPRKEITPRGLWDGGNA